MKAYELLFFVNPSIDDEARLGVKKRIDATITADGGVVDNVEEWGKRRLAYPIEDEVEGFYLFVEFTSAPEFPAELDRIYKITDGVLRSLIVSKVEA